METYGIRFEAVSPSLFPASKLAALISKFEKAIISVYNGDELDEKVEDGTNIVALTEIEDNCILLKFVASAALMISMQKVVELPINNFSNYGEANRSVKEFYQEMFNIKDYFHSPAEFIKFNGSVKEIVSRIEINDKLNEEKQTNVQSKASLYGEVIYIGGRTPKAKISFDTGEDIVCDLAGREALAQEIARYLYKEVKVTGTATYIVDKWNSKLTKMIIDTVELFDPPSLVDRIKNVSPYISNQLNKINDLSEYVRELREDD